MTRKTSKKSASEAASAIGRLGGRAIVKKRGKAYMQELGKKGADKRWENKPKKKK